MLLIIESYMVPRVNMLYSHVFVLDHGKGAYSVLLIIARCMVPRVNMLYSHVLVLDHGKGCPPLTERTACC